MARGKHIDNILRKWAYDPTTVSARMCVGGDGRDVLQMRVDMGLLQMEVDGRPDGERPFGYDTYFDYLLSQVIHDGDDFELTDEQCVEVDREFVQFYHRRVCWLRLQRYREAAEDADHTLALMDFCLHHASDEAWLMSHEQYRPFVLYHRVQAGALAVLEEEGPEAAVQEVNRGLQNVHELYENRELDEEFEDDELVQRLVRLRESLREQYAVGRTLHEQLADAVAAEQYELAAQLRDELHRRGADHS
jgi:hypothetical protein